MENLGIINDGGGVINVLCLHGCGQTRDQFEKLMKKYVKVGERDYNLKFYFTQAKYDWPFGAPGGKTWYKEPLIVSEIGKQPYDPILVKDTMDDIDGLIKHYDIHVLLGFSQGGNVVDTYFEYRRFRFPTILPLRAVIMSGYSFVDFRRSTDVPKLSVVSKRDKVVPLEYDPLNYNFVPLGFTGRLFHCKGHNVTQKCSIVKAVCNFIKSGTYPDGSSKNNDCFATCLF